MTEASFQHFRIVTPGTEVTKALSGDVLFTSAGILDEEGHHSPDAEWTAVVPLGSGGAVLGGTYTEVLERFAHATPPDNAIGIILARQNTPDLERFLTDLSSTSVAKAIRSWMGGVTAPVNNDGRGTICLGVGDKETVAVEDVAICLVPGAARTMNVHTVFERSVTIAATGRTLRSINGVTPRGVLSKIAAGHRVPDDLEHITVSSLDGRNIHLAKSDRSPKALVAGASIPNDYSDIRGVASIHDNLDKYLVDYDLAFSCAGLGSALEHPLNGRPGVVAWMYGEIVQGEDGPELGNLMTTLGRFGFEAERN